MKKHIRQMTIRFLAVLVAATATAQARDITIYDGKSNDNSSWYGKTSGSGQNQDQELHQMPPDGATTAKVLEDNEVENGMQTGQQWDMEVLHLNGNSLSVIGGYDFQNATGGYWPGDIFVDLSNNPNAIVNDANNTGGYSNFANGANGYEYVIAFNNYSRGSDSGGIGGGGYTVYRLDANSTLRSVQLEANDTSNPWRYVSGGVAVGTGTASYTTGLTDAQATAAAAVGTPIAEQRSLLGGTHNVLGNINLASLLFDYYTTLGNAAGGEVGLHLTMGCGNDEIVGWNPPSGGQVPDGGSTLVLLGLGALSVGFVARRKS